MRETYQPISSLIKFQILYLIKMCLFLLMHCIFISQPQNIVDSISMGFFQCPSKKIAYVAVYCMFMDFLLTERKVFRVHNTWIHIQQQSIYKSCPFKDTSTKQSTQYKHTVDVGCNCKDRFSEYFVLYGM